MQTAKYYIDNLHLQPHPEGGFFREFFRSDIIIKRENLPAIYNGDRNSGTSIYYLLSEKDVSKFHKLKSDEIWHHIDGCSVEIHTFDSDGNYECKLLGKDAENGCVPQIVIPRRTWFGAKLKDTTLFALVGCTVVPGFNFDDFQLGNRKDLLKDFPEHQSIILELTN